MALGDGWAHFFRPGLRPSLIFCAPSALPDSGPRTLDLGLRDPAYLAVSVVGHEAAVVADDRCDIEVEELFDRF